MVTNFARKNAIVLLQCLMIRNPLEYYFDINIKNITQKGNARTLDLFLDVLVLPSTGEYELVDEHDLELALKMDKLRRNNTMKPILSLIN